MSGEKGQTYATGLLQAIFTGVFTNAAISSLLRDAAAPLTDLYISLHSADPGATGSQTTSELTTGQYTTYERVAVARTTGGFTVGTATVSPAATVTFPACTGGSGVTATYFGIGTDATGTGHLLYAGPISPTIAIADGVTPELTTATAVTES
jgi:hypothetical protein